MENKKPESKCEIVSSAAIQPNGEIKICNAWLTVPVNGFECPHECGYVYSDEEGNEYAEQVFESKNKSGIIRRTSKCCKRPIYMTMGLLNLAVWKKPLKLQNNKI